jgi:hypothetical protein
MQQNDIKLKPIEENLNGELSERIFYECHFCNKKVGLLADQRKNAERLSGEQFYCNFCLQNSLHTKNNRHTLIMTFRGIIGYYHEILYHAAKKLYYSQVQDYIKAHWHTGLSNPLFRYDPDSYLWFVDFSRVGQGKKKIHVSEIHKTVINILACFNLAENIDHIRQSKLFEKYKDAIDAFHEKRYRPENKKILCPTLTGCGGQCDNKNIPHEELKNFTPADRWLR